MKKIIALVLALVMTLSLLPMTVWATEGESSPHIDNFFINRNESDIACYPTDGVYYLKPLIGGDPNGDVPVTQDAWSVAKSGNIGSVTWYKSDVLAWNIRGVAPDTTGTLTFTKNSDSTQTYTVNVKADNPEVSVYKDDTFLFRNDDNTYSYASGSTVKLHFNARGDRVITGITGVDSDWVTITENTVGNSATLTIPANVYGDQRIFVGFAENGGTNPRNMEFYFRDTTNESQLKWSYDKGNWYTGRIQEAPGGSNTFYLKDSAENPITATGWTASVFSAFPGSVSMTDEGLRWDRGMIGADTIGTGGIITISNGKTGNEAASYDVLVGISEPSVQVYGKDANGNFTVKLFADANWNYTYTSSTTNDVTFHLKARSDTTITKIGEENVSGSAGNSATITIPAGASSDQIFTVAITDGGGPRTTEIRFRDTNDTCDLFARAVWDNGSIVDPWGFNRLFAQAGQQMTVEFALPPEGGGMPADDAVMSLEGATVTISGNLGTVKISGNRVLWDCTTLIPGSTGSLKIKKGETTYNVPVVITPSLVSVYSAAPNLNDLSENYMVHDQYWCYTYKPGASTPQVFYLLAREGATFKALPDLLPDGFKVLDGSDGRLATYTIPADSYGMRWINVVLLNTWEENGTQHSEEIEWGLGFDQEKLTGDIVPDDKMHDDNFPYGMVPVGETGYYMAPIFYLYGKTDAMILDTQWFAEGGQLEAGIAVGFWKKIEGSEVLELVSGAEAAEFAKKFNNTLKFDIHLVKSVVNDTRFPYVRDISPTNDTEFYEAMNGYPLAQIYLFNGSSQGAWCFEVNGTYTDGDTEIPVVTYGRTEKREVPNIPLEIEGAPTIENINAALAAFVEPEGLYHLEVTLPEGELNGYIVVPENLDSVGFFGRMDQNYNILTTLKGGFEANNADLRVQGVRFEGAGVGRGENAKIPKEYGDRPNKAIYGTAAGAVYHCSFTGYDCAIEMTGGVIGSGALTQGIYPVEGTGTFFYDNTVGVMINIPKGDFSGQGDPKFWRTVMFDNETDIYYKSSGNRLDYQLDMSQTIFLRNDNKNSIHNTCGRTLFMPLNAFYNTKSGSNNGNNDPKVDGNVSIAPYYTLSEVGKAALIDNFNVAAMLRNPSYYKEWVTDTRMFPRNWICPANPDKELYSVGSENITEDEMTIDIIDDSKDDAYVGTIKLKKNK